MIQKGMKFNPTAFWILKDRYDILGGNKNACKNSNSPGIVLIKINLLSVNLGLPLCWLCCLSERQREGEDRLKLYRIVG